MLYSLFRGFDVFGHDWWFNFNRFLDGNVVFNNFPVQNLQKLIKAIEGDTSNEHPLY
jgi:hypothetical protein